MSTTNVAAEFTETFRTLLRQVGVSLGPETSQEQVHQKIREVTQQVADLLIQKNTAYGNSALEPLRVFSQADPLEQIRVRIDDKLSRIAHGTLDQSEDTIMDLIGYLVLYVVGLELAGERHG